jgi:hypothetical protein
MFRRGDNECYQEKSDIFKKCFTENLDIDDFENDGFCGSDSL